MEQELWNSQVVLHQDMTQEYVNTNWKEPVFVKSISGKLYMDKFIGYANTICSRDYKGFCKQGINGVLVNEK